MRTSTPSRWNVCGNWSVRRSCRRSADLGAVDEVKARIDIVELIGSYVPLQKAGRSFKARCPFHNERTPSFIVNPERQSWHCFGACATGGDIIAFVARKENLDFNAALRLLAERAGVELYGGGARRAELKTLYDVNEAAALYYHSLILSAGSPAMAYVEERGLDRDVVRAFHLGFSPPGWDGLRNHLSARGFGEAQLVEAGLVVPSERGASARGYDRFRGRLMFPIRDDRGRIAGFGGRGLPGAAPDEGAKYINTPQTPIFDKGSILYGLDRAKETIRNEGTAVIVEGYMDVIAAHQHGFRNAVASMGTSLTDRQAALARRFASTVVLAMDADEAGNAATLRAVQVVAAAADRPTGRETRGGATRPPLEVRVVALPQGSDPDDLIQSSPERWQTLVAAGRPVVEHLLDVVSGRLDLAEPRQRSLLVAEVLPTVADIGDPVVRAHYLQRLSRLARVDEETLRRESAPARRRRTAGREGVDETPGRVTTGPRALREEFCLALLFMRPEASALAAQVSEDLFSLTENRELLRRWRDGSTIDEDDPLWDHYRAVVATRLPPYDTHQVQAALSSCVRGLEQSRMKAVKEASALALAEGEARVRPGQVASIARARLESGQVDELPGESPEVAMASQLLDDMEAGLRFHRPLIESSRSEGPARPSGKGSG